MLLQQIVVILDEELNRLQQLRTVVSGLSGSDVTGLVGSLAMPLVPEKETVPAPAPVRARTRKEPRTPRAAREPKREPKHSTTSGKKPAKTAPALSGTIPQAPVMVRREALVDEKTRRAGLRKAPEESKPELPVGSLGAMIRALRPEAGA